MTTARTSNRLPGVTGKTMPNNEHTPAESPVDTPQPESPPCAPDQERVDLLRSKLGSAAVHGSMARADSHAEQASEGEVAPVGGKKVKTSPRRRLVLVTRRPAAPVGGRDEALQRRISKVAAGVHDPVDLERITKTVTKSFEAGRIY